MNWKDILKGEELNPNVRSLDAKKQKEMKEEIKRLEDLYNTEPLNTKREKEVMDRIKELSAKLDIKPKRMRPQNENDKTLYQLDVMEAFRDFALDILVTNFKNRQDNKNDKGEVKMPKDIVLIGMLKKFDKGYYLGEGSIKDLITPSEFISKERKLAFAIVNQILNTLKVFPDLEISREERNKYVYYSDKFIEWAKSKLPRLTTSIATD